MNNKWYDKKVMRLIEKELNSNLTTVGTFVASQAMKEIIGMKAVDSGRLLNSIYFETGKDVVMIGTNVEYAQWIELGTSKMAPRPFLRNAINKNKKKIERILSK